MGSPGIISVRGNADAARDKAGQDALHVPVDEFETSVPADLQLCFNRLEEIRTELGILYAKMYNVQAKPTNGWGETSQPPYQVRLAIQLEMDDLNREECDVMARIQELKWILPVNDQDGDAAEDEDEKGDMTQAEGWKQ